MKIPPITSSKIGCGFFFLLINMLNVLRVAPFAQVHKQGVLEEVLASTNFWSALFLVFLVCDELVSFENWLMLLRDDQ